jgi:hypothetical protein
MKGGFGEHEANVHGETRDVQINSNKSHICRKPRHWRTAHVLSRKGRRAEGLRNPTNVKPTKKTNPKKGNPKEPYQLKKANPKERQSPEKGKP